MAEVDPYKELVGRGLRNVVLACLAQGLILLPQRSGARSHAEERMDERHVTAPEIENVLRSGALTSSGCVARKWRYLARRAGIEVVFTFDVDDDGNLLVVVTVMRNQ